MFNDQTQTDLNWDGFFMIIHYSVLSALICTWVAFSKKKVTRFPVLPAESGNHSTCLALLGPPLGESPGAHAEHSAGMERLLPRLEEGASSRQKARREWGWMGTPGKEQAEGSDRTGCASEFCHLVATCPGEAT